jgi:hypothetical protein
MTTRTLAKLIVCMVAGLFALGPAELVVRLRCTHDADGNVTFQETHLMPYRVPVLGATKVVEQYLKTNDSAIIYDPELGWNQRQSAATHNVAGFISVQSAIPRERPAEKLRIALFGGSYTLGSFEHGWWRILENELNKAGVPAEVLNFGVSGFGMDQAYLRWKRDGQPYQPHVVLFGFSAGNCCDNVNVARVFRDFSTGIPFTKPRFVIEDGQLTLINSPTSPPEAVPGLLATFVSSPLKAHEWFYRDSEFEPRWWRVSRLTALIEAKTSRTGTHLPPEHFYRL